MSRQFYMFYFPLIALFATGTCLKPTSLQNIYEKGVKAYSDERWSECIKQLEESIHLYKLFKSITVNCRQKCNSQPYQSEIKENIGELMLYEHFFIKKDCLTKCEDNEFADVHLDKVVEDKVLYSMQDMKPYEYLHMCYYQMNMKLKAASAAYTYLAQHPNDKDMEHNVKFYSYEPEVDPEEIVDLESEDYAILYPIGLKAYNQRNWADTVANMEEVLNDYILSEGCCRSECERQPAQEWSTEFTITMSNNIAALLHCQQQCQDKLKLLKYNSGAEFIADVLNYIQICYYHLERYDDAAKAVATYLTILPNDEDMLKNKEIYSSLVDAKLFSGRSDIEYYIKHDQYEKKLLKFFHQGNHHITDSNSL